MKGIGAVLVIPFLVEFIDNNPIFCCQHRIDRRPCQGYVHLLQ